VCHIRPDALAGIPKCTQKKAICQVYMTLDSELAVTDQEGP